MYAGCSECASMSPTHQLDIQCTRSGAPGPKTNHIVYNMCIVHIYGNTNGLCRLKIFFIIGKGSLLCNLKYVEKM